MMLWNFCWAWSDTWRAIHDTFHTWAYKPSYLRQTKGKHWSWLLPYRRLFTETWASPFWGRTARGLLFPFKHIPIWNFWCHSNANKIACLCISQKHWRERTKQCCIITYWWPETAWVDERRQPRERVNNYHGQLWGAEQEHICFMTCTLAGWVGVL